MNETPTTELDRSLAALRLELPSEVADHHETIVRRTLGEVADQLGGIATEAAREAVASLAGLVLRRLQGLARSPERGLSAPELELALRKVFGEALEQFTAGPEPVEPPAPVEPQDS